MCKEHSGREITIVVTSSFSKSSVFKTVFCPHKNIKPMFIYSFCLKSVFEKHSFRDGLLWTVGRTVEIKFRHQISPTLCGRGVGVLMLLFAGEK